MLHLVKMTVKTIDNSKNINYLDNWDLLKLPFHFDDWLKKGLVSYLKQNQYNNFKIFETKSKSGTIFIHYIIQ